MRCKFSDTKFRWALWLGVGLFLGAMLTNALFSWLDISSVQQVNGAGILESCGYFVGFLLIVLLVPIVEEVVYRFWGRGTTVGYVVTIVLVPIFMLITTFNWVASVSILVALLAAYWLSKGDLRLLLFMIITALGFGFGHVLSYTELNIAAIMNMVEMVGLAFMLSFLSVNYGLIWAMVGHSLYNLIAFFVMLLPVTFQTEHYNVELRPLSSSHYVSEERHGDTLIVRGSPELATTVLTAEQDVVDDVKCMQRTTFYREGMSKRKVGEMQRLRNQVWIIPKYEMTITKKCGEFRPNYNEVIRGIEDLGLIKLDTIYEPLYELHVENSLYVKPPVELQKGTLEGLILSMQMVYDLQVLPADEMMLSMPVAIDYRMLGDMSLSEFVEVLRSNGLMLNQSKNRRARIITYCGI